MKRMIAIACALVMIPVLAAAEPKTSDEWYKQGEDQYNLGNFDKAVESFKKGYELEQKESKKAAYLFNIAQAYRQAKNCTEAQFFYKRYLAVKDADTKKPLDPADRQQIEERIKELDECAKQQAAIANKPPISPIPSQPDPTKPDPTKVAVVVPEKPEPEDPDPGITKTGEGPSVISVRAFGGGAKLTLADLEVPVQATGGVLAGYPLRINEKMTVEVGGGFTFTPVPFKNMDRTEDKTANMIGVLANASLVYAVAPKIAIRGDGGLGLLVFTGASESPFTGFAETTGSLSMLHVRAGVSADFAITQNLIATLMPIAFSFSPGAKGLETEDGDKINPIALDFMVGLGYRM